MSGAIAIAVSISVWLLVIDVAIGVALLARLLVAVGTAIGTGLILRLTTLRMRTSTVRLRWRLLRLVVSLVGHDQPIIVFGVLEVVLGHHAVSRRVRVAGQLKVLLVDVVGVAPDLHVRAVRVDRPVNVEDLVLVLLGRSLVTLSATAAATAATTTTVMLAATATPSTLVVVVIVV